MADALTSVAEQRARVSLLPDLPELGVQTFLTQQGDEERDDGHSSPALKVQQTS
jgi:hypothetical protein